MFQALAILSLVLGASVWLAAQQQRVPEAPATFTSRVDLVLVPVHVSRHGLHVPNIEQASFTLLQDGQPQKIDVFEEVRTTTQRLQRVAMPRGEFTNELRGNPNAARYTVIAIDRINTSTMDMNRLREGLMKFLTEATDAGEPIRLIAINPSSVDILQDFTTDPKVLAAALTKRSTPAGKADENSNSFNEMLRDFEAWGISSQELDAWKEQEQQMLQFQERGARITSLEALQRVALSLAGLPGRKSLVWASSGYPFSSIAREGRGDDPRMAVKLSFGTVVEATNLDEYTTHLLNTANIAVYPVDARGLINTDFQVIDPSMKNSPTVAQREVAILRNRDIKATFESLAASTGGKPCYERSDLSGCFKEALEDERDYYMLGYYINRQKLQPGWHKISVKIAEKGASVRSRNGFLVTKFTEEQAKELDLGLESGSRLVNPGLPFRGRWTGATPKGDKKAESLELKIPGSAGLVGPEQTTLNLEIAALARKPDGSVAAQFAQHIERNLTPEAVAAIQREGITYRNVLQLPPGKYLVRIVVRDNNTARMGSLSTLLTVN
jgi:VWFA-related protein